MTAPALDLFGDLGEVGEMAASLGVGGEPRGQSAVAEAPSVRSDAADTFAPVAFDGGQLLRVFEGRVGEYSVPLSLPPCILCDQELSSEYTGRGLAFLEDGSFGWAHTDCMVKVLKHRTNVQGWHQRFDHAACAACGRPWDDHSNYGYETLVCPTWDGGAAAVPLYQHAPGHVGPLREPWLVIAGEQPCGCHEKQMEEAA